MKKPSTASLPTAPPTRSSDLTDYSDKSAPESRWSRFPWRWMVSLRVGLVVLAILTVASIAGTLITPLERAQAIVYYAWWYKVLLVALAVNMACATLRTIGRKILPPLATWIRRSPQFFESARPSASRPFQGTVDQVAEAFRRHGYAVATEGDFGFAFKGRISRWGAPISHLGLVLILLCGFASSWVAREGMVQIVEGHETNAMQVVAGAGGEKEQEVPLEFTLRLDDFDTAFFPRTQIASKFVSTVTALRNGHTLYHGIVEVNNSPRVGAWTLHQTSYSELRDRSSERYRLKVTSPELKNPATMEVSVGQIRAIPKLPGVTLGLASGSPLSWQVRKAGQTIASGGLAQEYRFHVSVADAKSGAALGHFALSLNKPVTVKPGGDATSTGTLTLVADRFEPDFVIGQNRAITSRSQEVRNPALHVKVVEGDREVSAQWLFGREELKNMMHAAGGPLTLDLEGVDRVSAAEAASPSAAASGWNVEIVQSVPTYASVLSLTRNPAIPVIYAACTLMMIGLVVGFFLVRKEVWFRVDSKGGRLQVAAVYRYGREVFDHEVRGLLDRIAPEK